MFFLMITYGTLTNVSEMEQKTKTKMGEAPDGPSLPNPAHRTAFCWHFETAKLASC